MATNRANAGAFTPDVTADHGKIGELLHVLRTPPVLRNTHAIDNDGALGLHIDMGRIFDLLTRETRIAFDVIPSGGLKITNERFDTECLSPDEVPVQNFRMSVGARGLVGLDQD